MVSRIIHLAVVVVAIAPVIMILVLIVLLVIILLILIVRIVKNLHAVLVQQGLKDHREQLGDKA